MPIVDRLYYDCVYIRIHTTHYALRTTHRIATHHPAPRITHHALSTTYTHFAPQVSVDSRLRGVAETNASRAHEMRSLYKDATPRVFHTLNQAVLTRIFLDQKRRNARGLSKGRVPSMALDHNASFCLNLFSASPRRTACLDLSCS